MIRFEEEDEAELAEILHCDWDHEADDVRRLPRGEDGAADWVCYEHYLREAETRDVLPWIALLSQSQEPEVVMARDLADVFLDLVALYRAGHQFRLVSVNHSHRPPNLQVDLTTLGCIVASTADITWEMLHYGDGDWNLQATADMFGVEFMALTKDLEIAEEWGCPEELLR